LWRFTLVTVAVSVLSAAVLALTMERAHRKAIETNAEVSALGRISADLAAPLDSLTASGRLTDTTLRALTRASDNIMLFEYVSGSRVYRPNGMPVFPRDAPPATRDVQAALASDNFLRVAHGTKITAYAPLYTRNEQAYVIAVDFEQAQLGGTYARERGQLFSVVGIVSAISFISLLTLAAGASRELERRRREAQSTFVHTLGIMAEVIDLRDPYTAGHSKRVAAYSRALAVSAGLTEREIEVIESGALLHDIGKIGVPDAILFKPAGLNPDERRVMSTHPVVGARLLSGISAMEDVVPCVLHHHEKLDGTGYPDHLAGEAIPLGARVIAVADTFDAMTTDRPYRGALSSETALTEMLRVAGTQLDERLVLVFAELVVRGEIVPPPSLAQSEGHLPRPVAAPAVRSAAQVGL
jgi:putative nucleotidyltransferase with HDIG domain